MPRELIETEGAPAAGAGPADGDTLESLLQRRYEPIAIVGVGLRFPGGSGSLDDFSQFLAEGKSGISPLPTDRWDAAAFTPDGPDDRGKIRTTAGGFLDRIDLFDPMFFNISPREAQYIDPQQRMLLETAWQALEHANIDPTGLRRSNGAVYIGASSIDYALEMDGLDYQDLDGLLASGITMFPLSGRLSYFLGWRGPSASIDTACSSSLTALHMAVQALRQQECDIALCGGVNALHHPRIPVIFSHAQMLAPDGQCKTFDDEADGYVRAEGCGVIVLKRLSSAQRDGNTVLALIRGTAVGQDGDSAGLTVPNGAAQEIVIRTALSNARLEPADIQYVEAHGTGTPLGDPIELGAINEVFTDSHDKDNPLLVGSVKTNLGHMEPASGLVGLIKVVAQLRDQVIYPHLNLSTPSGRIPWNIYPIEIPLELRTWQAPIRRAVVNSFGFAGTIAAVVLEQPPDRPQPGPATAPAAVTGQQDDAGEQPRHVLTVSAKSAAALQDQVAGYRQFVLDNPTVEAGELCHSANAGRAHFKYRIAGVVRDRADVLELLDRELERTDRPEPSSIRKVAFLFSGQGSQYPGMGAALYRQYPVFARWVDECDTRFQPMLGLSVKDLLVGDGAADPELIHQTRYTQPALFTLEYALAKLWISWGVQPGVLIGHSIGEVVAAAVAGLFDLPDAITLVAARGRLMQSVRAPGGMAAVNASAEDVLPFLQPHQDLALAAINAPDQCVVSGGSHALGLVSAALTGAGFKVNPLAVSHAFHSPLMAEVYEEFRAVVSRLEFHEPSMSIVSNITGAMARRSELSDPEYWVRHVGMPVRFCDGVRAGVRRGRHALIEIGPSNALTALASRCLEADEHAWLASLRRSDRSGQSLVRSLAAAYQAGLPVQWSQVHGGQPQTWLSLPSYPFQRRRYWLPTSTVRRGAASAVADHPLLGSRTPLDPASVTSPDAGATRWEFVTSYRRDQPDVLAEHLIDGQPVVPVSAYIETLLAAQDAVWGHTGRVIGDLRVLQPLVLEDDDIEINVTLASRTASDPTVDVSVDSVVAGQRITHASATLSVQPLPLVPGDALWELLYAAGPVTGSVPAADLYTDLVSVGKEYGPRFRLLHTVNTHPEGVLTAQLSCPESRPVEQVPVEVLEASLQALAGADIDGVARSVAGVQAIRMFKKPRGSQLHLVARIQDGPQDSRVADLLLVEGETPVAELRSISLVPAGRSNFQHELAWVVADTQLQPATSPRQVIAINADSSELAGLRRADTVTALDGVSGLGAALSDPGVSDVYWFWRPGTAPVCAETLAAECEANFTELLDLIAALEASPPSRQLRLRLVTRGAQLLPQDKADDGGGLAANSLWGFGRVLLTEHPRYSPVMIDLDPGDDRSVLEVDRQQGPTSEFQVAYRGGQRYVRRLQPVQGDSAGAEHISDTLRLRADRTYLITGGLGGLGLASAQKLVDLGARRLVLVSRRCQPTPEAAEVLRRLGERAEVRLLPADLGSASDVRQLFQLLSEDELPIGGIVHAAGEIGKCLIGALSWPAIEEQIRPKIYGGWLLHEATRQLADLEFFVVYSSIAGVMGGATQAHYSAASTYLDGLARWRRAAGLPGLAVSWGAWSGVGMSARLDAALSKQVQLGGVRYFSPTRALRSMAEILDQPVAHRIVGEYDWNAMAALRGGVDALYALVATPVEPVAAGLDIAALIGKPEPERLADIRSSVGKVIAAALQYDDLDALDPTAELVSLGLDSLMAMEVKRGLDAAFGLSLVTSVAYDYPTISQLSGFVNSQLPVGPDA